MNLHFSLFPASRQLLLVDPRVQDYQHLIAGSHPGIEPIILKPDQDGLTQITQILSAHQPVTHLHLVCHGQPGSLLLGKQAISLQTLLKRRQDIQQWQACLEQDASILLYGCNLAANSLGEAFLQALHYLTGASIFASSRPVGNPRLGGWWRLDVAAIKKAAKEKFQRILEPILAFTPETRSSYAHVLMRVEAEDFKPGGQGVGYNDLTPTINLGNAYRNTGVDLEANTDPNNPPGGTGYGVGWIQAGEWTAYDITVPTTGTYNITARVSSLEPGPHQLNLTLGGQNLGTLTFNGTGSWQNWTDVTLAGVSLPAGASELRLNYLTSAYNVNYVDIAPVAVPAPGTVRIGETDLFVSEGVGSAQVPIIRDGGTSGTIVVEYQTSAGSATSGVDYTGVDGGTASISLGDGITTGSFPIRITDDTTVEVNEEFGVGIQSTNLGAPRTGLITIVDNDGATRFFLSDSSFNVIENEGTVEITVVRAGPNNRSSRVNYTTSNGTARAGQDYTSVSGQITFNPGEIVKTFTIPINNDIAQESNETFNVSLRNPSGGRLGDPSTATVNIIDNDPSYTRTTLVSGLSSPIALAWTPDERNLLVAQKDGVVRVVKDGVLQPTPLIDLQAEVNTAGDRGLLSMALHPDLANNPYLYIAHTYDPPQTVGSTGLAAPDGGGNRPSRLVRYTLSTDASSNLSVVPGSQVVLLGKNSVWDYTSRPDADSTSDLSIPPSGIVGATITAPADQVDPGNNIRDYLATDSMSHSMGDLEFAFENGRYVLYVSNGDGTSYNFVDTRSQRVQDINNLSGKLLRIDPLSGQGLADNPFYTNDGVDNNRDKVFQLGMRNPFRFAIDPVTNLPVIGDVGWTRWEEINSAPAGANFGWPFYEGGNGTSLVNQEYQDELGVPGFTPTAPVLGRSHDTDGANAIIMGDFLTDDQLVFGDAVNGNLYLARTTADATGRRITSVGSFDTGVPFIVDMEVGPDGFLYGTNLVDGTVVRWA
jgi:glucose/arabinose dehydrogenase